MRKFLTIATLALMMFGLLFFEFSQSSQLPFEPKVLAASGFILLAAYTIGEVVQRFGPPKLVGYIITGVLFGPHLAPLIFGEGTKALFGSDVVEDLSLINALAQGLIGLTAGGELLVNQLRQDARTIAFTLLMETLLVFAAVGAAVAALAWLVPSTMPFLGVGQTMGVVAAVLLFGALAVGTSPSTTLAVITETGAQGPLKRATLGLVVAKDVSTVVLFLTCLAVAAALLDPSGGGFSASALVLIAEELGGAIVVGAILGCLMWIYLRWVRAEMLLFVVGVVFVGMWVARQLHIEALLMFIVAGFFIANKIPFVIWRGIRTHLVRRPYSPEQLAEEERLDLGHVLIHELERLSLPVFVVFFTIAAAKLQLAALKDFWVIALVYVVVRAIFMYLGTQAGVKLAKAPEGIQKRLWMGMFPQAGVTLTLAALATGKIPWAADFQTIIMATILGNIVVGPTLLKVALTQAGEAGAGGGGHGGHGASQEEGHGHAAPDGVEVGLVEADNLKLQKEFGRRQASELIATFASPRFGEDALNEPLLKLRRRLLRIYAGVERGYLRERHAALAAQLRELHEAHTAALAVTLKTLEAEAEFARELGDAPASSLDGTPLFRDREKLKAVIRQGKADLAERTRGLVQAMVADFPSSARAENTLISILEQVEASVEFEQPVVSAPQEDAHFTAQDEDPLTLRVIKALKRIGRAAGGFRTRLVDLFLLTRYFVELPMPGHLATLADTMGAQHRYMWLKARILYALADKVYDDALLFLDDAHLAAAGAPRSPSSGHRRPALEAPDADLESLSDPAQVIQAIESALRAEPLPQAAAPRESAIDQLIAFFSGRVTELKTEGELVAQDLETFHEELRLQTKELLARPYGQLVEACQRAGTVELRDRSFRASRLFDENRQQRQRMLETLREWTTYNRGLAGRFLVELDIARTQGRLRGVLAATLQATDDQLLSILSYYPIELGERVLETRTQIDSALVEGADPEEVRRLIARQRTLLLSFIHSTALTDMEEAQETRRFADILGLLFKGLDTIIEEAREVALVLPEPLMACDESTGLPGPVELAEIPAKALLREVLEREIGVQLSDVELRLGHLIEETSRGLMELGHVIGFNLDAAMSELEAPGQEIEWPQTSALPSRSPRRFIPQEPLRDERGKVTYAGIRLPREFAVGGLDRALERVDGLVRHVDANGQNLKGLILNETVKQAREVRSLLLKSSPTQIRAFLAQRDLSAAASEARDGAGTAFSRLRGWLQRAVDVLPNPLREQMVTDLQRQLQLEQGLLPELDAEAVDVGTVLDVWGREDLPNIYRRLFAPTPNEVPEFFVGRPELVQRFNHGVEQWLHGNFTSLAIIGEPGSGRSSFIDHMLRSRLQGMNVVRRRLGHTIREDGALIEEFGAIAGGRRNLDLESLKATIRSRKERSVVVIEESENLFLRSLGGLRTLEHFLQLVTETGDRVLWVLCMDRHAWDYLDMVVHMSQHFTHHLSLRPFSRAEVEELILTRHRMSGYELRFHQPPTGLQRIQSLLGRALGGAQDTHGLAQRAFFDALHGAAHGNPMMAIFLWLRAARVESEKTSTLDILPLQPLQTELLHALDDHKLLVLANVILHNGLTVREYGAIFRVDTDKALANLQHLFNLRLLHITPGSEPTYRLRQILYPLVARHLRARNML